MTEEPNVAASLEDDTGDRCVDILAWPDGTFSFVQCHRNSDGDQSWHQESQADGPRFPSQSAAYFAALKAVPWLID